MYVDPDLGDQAFEIIEMRTGRCVEVVLGDAGGQLHNDAIFIDSFLLLDPSGQVAQLPMQRPAAAAAAGQIERAISFVPGIAGKSACALMERFFAIVAGTSFLDDVTLYDDDVIFALKIDHIPNVSMYGAVRNKVLIFNFWSVC